MCCWAQFTDRGYCVAGVYTASVRPGTFTQSTATVFSVLHRKLLTLTYLYRQIHLSKQVHVIYACLTYSVVATRSWKNTFVQCVLTRTAQTIRVESMV